MPMCTTSLAMPARRTPAEWWKTISALCGSWTNSRMDRPRTRSFTRSQSRHSSHVRWDQGLKDNLGRRKAVTYSPDNVWATQYRPFVKQHCYVENVFIHRKGQMDSIFPASDSENRAICVTGIGSTKPFSALVADTMPDIQLMFNGQCFPRYRYRERAEVQRELPGIESGRERLDNISDTALRAFRVRYNDNTITKDAIFDYVYGVLHAPTIPGTLRQRSGQGTTAHPARARFSCLCPGWARTRGTPSRLRGLCKVSAGGRVRALRRPAPGAFPDRQAGHAIP